MFAFVSTVLATSHTTERITYPPRPPSLPQLASLVVVIVMDRVLDKVTVSPFPNAPNSSIPPVTFGITVEVEVNVSNSVAGANAATPLAATPRTIMIIIMIVCLGLRFSSSWREGVSAAGGVKTVIPPTSASGARAFIAAPETRRRGVKRDRSCANRILLKDGRNLKRCLKSRVGTGLRGRQVSMLELTPFRLLLYVNCPRLSRSRCRPRRLDRCRE